MGEKDLNSAHAGVRVQIRFLEGELVGCFKINSTHFLVALISPQLHISSQPDLGHGSLSRDCNPMSLSHPKSEPENRPGVWPSGSASLSFLQGFSEVGRVQTLPPLLCRPPSLLVS